MSNYNCLDDSPIEGDPRYGYSHDWHTGMFASPCADPLCYCGSLLCLPCSAFLVRREVLGGDMSRYKCCQGYYDSCCFTAGSYGEESMPDLCLCIEVLCFEACSISATRMFIMDTRNIRPDPCDSRLIRFNNCLFLLSCICNILAIIDDSFDAIADIVELASDIVYLLTASCMLTQTHVEVKNAPRPLDWSRAGLHPRSGSKEMRNIANGQGGGIPMQANMGGGGGGCPRCRTPVSPGERFCSNCGNPV